MFFVVMFVAVVVGGGGGAAAAYVEQFLLLFLSHPWALGGTGSWGFIRSQLELHFFFF